MKPISFHKPFIGKQEKKAILDLINRGWLTTGPKTHLFEKNFSHFLKVQNALAVSSCSAALHLALKVLNIKKGDEVITTPFTFPATVEVILQSGAVPKFVDINPQTFNIDSSQIKRAITQKTKVILPVHYAGQACDMGTLKTIARKNKLKIIEDAAHAFPTKCGGKFVGALGDMTCFSFYATKTLTTGEGGMLVSNNKKYIKRARSLSLHGMSRDVWKRRKNNGSWFYDVVELGYKYNMGDLQAALGVQQLAKANQMLEMRRKIAKIYNQYFKKCDLLERPYVESFEDHSWHLYVIKLESARLKISRDQFINLLKEKGISTSVHFIPIHMHSFYRKKFGFKFRDFPNAYQCYSRVVSLPIYPGLKTSEVKYIADTVKVLLKQNSYR